VRGLTPQSDEEQLAGAKARLMAAVEEKARVLRVGVAGTGDASKLAVYQAKYDTAIAALSGNKGALADLAPEAAARGNGAAELAAVVKARGDQWRAAGLSIDAAHQRHKAAIASLDLVGVLAYDMSAGWPDFS
jgi:hypothetical protein